MAKKKTEKESPFVPVEEQPYRVPENWCWVYGDKIFKPMETKKPIGHTFAYIDIDAIDNANQCVKSPKMTETAKAPSRASRGLHEGDTLFSMVRPYLKNIAYIDETLENCIASTGFYVCSPIKGLNNKYIYRLMTSGYVVDGLNQYMKGDNSPSIRSGDIEKYPFPIPPHSEQQRIVDCIESLFAKLDEAREKMQEALGSFESRKNIILYKAFSGRLTNKWRNENRCSHEWRIVPLTDICDLRSGTTIPVEEELQAGTIPYVKVADMNLPENQTFITTSSRFVNHCDKNHEIPFGSTIFPKRGGAIFTNKKRLVAVDKIIMDLNTMAILPNNDIVDNKYIFYWMQSVDLKSLNNGSSVPQINNKDMVKLFVPISEKEEQKEVVRILDDFFAKEAEAREKVESALDAIETIKKSILAKAFRGELGTNNPEDESAEELLKRTLA